MSTYYNIHTVVGVPIRGMLKVIYKPVSCTRYNPITGEPYEYTRNANIAVFDGSEYPVEYMGDGSEDYPKCALQLAVEEKFGGLTFLYPGDDPADGVVGVPIGTEQELGSNVYADGEIDLNTIYQAFATFNNSAPSYEPLLLHTLHVC